MYVEITDSVTVDEGVNEDGEICINVMGSHEEAYAYLTKEDVEKILAMFEEVV